MFPTEQEQVHIPGNVFMSTATWKSCLKRKLLDLVPNGKINTEVQVLLLLTTAIFIRYRGNHTDSVLQCTFVVYF